MPLPTKSILGILSDNLARRRSRISGAKIFCQVWRDEPSVGLSRRCFSEARYDESRGDDA